MMRFFLLLSLFFICTSCEKRGVTLRKVVSTHRTDPKWTTKDISEKKLLKVRSLLDQPFQYIGRGNHCYAFESADGKYILKLFRQNHLGRHKWKNFLPIPASWFPIYHQRFDRQLRRRKVDFTGYKLAYEQLPQETGLIYLHLTPTKTLKKNIPIFYHNKRMILLDPDDSEFLIQKKADIGFAPIERHLRAGRKKEAFQLIESFLHLIHTRCQKGFSDSDLQFYKNFGFADGQAIEIDTGYLTRDKKMRCNDQCKEELYNVSLQFRNYFFDHHPLLKKELEEHIDAFISSL